MCPSLLETVSPMWWGLAAAPAPQVETPTFVIRRATARVSRERPLSWAPREAVAAEIIPAAEAVPRQVGSVPSNILAATAAVEMPPLAAAAVEQREPTAQVPQVERAPAREATSVAMAGALQAVALLE